MNRRPLDQRGFLSGMDRPIRFLSPGPDTTDFHLEIVSAITHQVS
jgi:hypothetical protein